MEDEHKGEKAFYEKRNNRRKAPEISSVRAQSGDDSPQNLPEGCRLSKRMNHIQLYESLGITQNMCSVWFCFSTERAMCSGL